MINFIKIDFIPLIIINIIIYLIYERMSKKKRNECFNNDFNSTNIRIIWILTYKYRKYENIVSIINSK